jgi:hypothetical protein
MGIPIDVAKEAARRALKAKFPEVGEGLALVLFGNGKIPAIIDAAQLAAAADSRAAGEELTNDVAMAIIEEALKKTVAASLQATAGTALKRAGYSAAAIAGILAGVFMIVVTPEQIAPDPPLPPPPTPPAPPTVAPTDPTEGSGGANRPGPGSGIGPGGRMGGGRAVEQRTPVQPDKSRGNNGTGGRAKDPGGGSKGPDLGRKS